MIKSFKHKGLEKFFNRGSTAGIQVVHKDRLEEELLSNLVYGLGRAPVRLFHYLFTILELNIVDHKGQLIKSSNPLPALLRRF